MDTTTGISAHNIHGETITPRSGPAAALVWACFLGCSWTWVIGMFFPVLLLRDYGVWGWVAFAAPNVIGAAAMGFVLSPQRARTLWEQHAGAVRWFSDVTLGFHVFVLMWLGTQLFGPAAWAACALPLLILPGARRKAWGPWLPAVAVGVAGVSWICLSFWIQGEMPGEWAIVKEFFDKGPSMESRALHGYPDVQPPRRTMLDLWIFVPASITGFLCCPYLDGTFLRARASTGRNTGRAAFALGFGVVFFSMIVFSLAYAAWLIPAFDGQPVRWQKPLFLIVGVHVLVQAAFTMTLHLRERETLNPDGRNLWSLSLVLLVAMGFVLLTRQLPGTGGGVRGVSWAEIGYRSFLLMYGLVFPAYVWLVVLSKRDVSRAMLTRFFLTILIAVPMGWVGFVLGPSWWLLGAMGIITVAKAVPAPGQTA